MTTNPNGKGAGQQCTVEGSIPSVVVLPSEAAQNLAYHLDSHCDSFIETKVGSYYPVIDIVALSRIIQNYWDSQM